MRGSEPDAPLVSFRLAATLDVSLRQRKAHAMPWCNVTGAGPQLNAFA